jgi:hypothetical protein
MFNGAAIGWEKNFKTSNSKRANGFFIAKIAALHEELV